MPQISRYPAWVCYSMEMEGLPNEYTKSSGTKMLLITKKAGTLLQRAEHQVPINRDLKEKGMSKGIIHKCEAQAGRSGCYVE